MTSTLSSNIYGESMFNNKVFGEAHAKKNRPFTKILSIKNNTNHHDRLLLIMDLWQAYCFLISTEDTLIFICYQYYVAKPLMEISTSFYNVFKYHFNQRCSTLIYFSHLFVCFQSVASKIIPIKNSETGPKMIAQYVQQA